MILVLYLIGLVVGAIAFLILSAKFDADYYP